MTNLPEHLQKAAAAWETRIANGEVKPVTLSLKVSDVTPEGFGPTEEPKETDKIDELWDRFLAGDLSAIEESKNI